MGSFDKLKDIILSHDKFLLICHEHPDGDSIGSLLSLSEALNNLGKSATPVSSDSVPKVFSYLAGSDNIKHDFAISDYDVVISLDNGDCRRTGFYDRIAQIKKLKIPFLNIDHHPKNDLWRIADVNYVKGSLSSTCEIIYEILQGMRIEITPNMATALLTGIFTDTGGFQHTNTSENVFMITSDLLNKGARLRKISENISNSHSISMLKLWGIALSRLTSIGDLGLVYSILTKEDIRKVKANEEEVSGLVNLINSIPESKISFLLYETQDGKIKGSLRTESDEINLSKVAAIFGGGGHKKASGFSISGKLKHSNGLWQIV
jgi:phosphoesterase RecJ-like protein